jgi:hypothetical protein
MTLTRASNWVDRGEAPAPVVQRTLMFFFDRHTAADAEWLNEAAQTLIGMVDADASEVLVAGYLKHVARTQGIEFPAHARMASAAVWHIAKAALVRDAAARLLKRAAVAPRETVTPPLSVWLAERLLTPEELAQLGDATTVDRPDVPR